MQSHFQRRWCWLRRSCPAERRAPGRSTMSSPAARCGSASIAITLRSPFRRDCKLVSRKPSQAVSATGLPASSASASLDRVCRRGERAVERVAGAHGAHRHGRQPVLAAIGHLQCIEGKSEKQRRFDSGSLPSASPPAGTLSPPIRQPEKRVVSKAFAGRVGNHAARSRPLAFSL